MNSNFGFWICLFDLVVTLNNVCALGHVLFS